MKFKKVEIQAFKSYVEKLDGTFNLMVGEEPAKIVVIYAPNGFGKTSFYDAVDYTITNNISRYIRNSTIKNLNDKLSSEQLHASKDDSSNGCLLRAKNNPKNLVTKINVETTIKNFSAEIKTVKNKRDYIFNDSKTPKDRLFFRDVILSQEAIDTFLRESRPEQRYQEFINFQTGEVKELEKKRSIINRTVQDLENKKSYIDREISIIREKAEAISVDENVKLELENLSDELNQKGIEIPKLSVNSDENTINLCQLALNYNQHNYSKLIVTKETQCNQLSDAINSFASTQECIELYKSTQTEKQNLEEKKYTLHHLKFLMARKEKIVENKAIQEKELRMLKSYRGKLEEFIVVSNKLSAISKKNSELNNEINDLNIQNSALECKISNINEQIDSANEIYNKNKTKLEKVDTLCSSIEINQASLSESNAELRQSVEKIESETKVKRKIRAELDRLLAVNFDSPLWVGKLIALGYYSYGQSTYANDLISQIEQLQQDIINIDLDIRNYESSGNKVISLIDLGLEFLSQEHSKDLKNCPLCYHEYNSHKDLCYEINNNNKYASKIGSDFTEKKWELLKRLDNTQTEYNEIRNSAKSIIDNEIGELNIKLALSNDVIESESGNVDRINAYINKLNVALTELYTETNGLDRELLVARYNQIDKSTKATLSELVSLKDSIQLEINNNKNKIQVFMADIVSSDNESSDVKFYWDYRFFLDQEFSYKQFYEPELDIVSINEHFDEQLSVCGRAIEITKNDVNSIDSQIDESKERYEEFREKCIIEIEDDLSEILSFTEGKIKDLSSKLADFNNLCLRYKLTNDIFNDDLISLKESILNHRDTINNEISNSNEIIQKISIFSSMLVEYKKYIDTISYRKELDDFCKELSAVNKLKDELLVDLRSINSSLKIGIDNFFYTDLINKLYNKIDPHPEFKKVKFDCSFDDNERPKLNVYLEAKKEGDIISPNLYLSSAQICVLSLSIFLARAINNRGFKDKKVDCILIDDPIQSMDSINVLSTIDLLRSVALNLDKQIIISTHDDKFFKLMKAKIPNDVSKFIELESYGKVKQDIM